MRLKLFAKKTLPFFVLLFLLVTLSCTHNPEIINLDTGTDTGIVPYELLGKKYSYII